MSEVDWQQVDQTLKNLGAKSIEKLVGLIGAYGWWTGFDQFDALVLRAAAQNNQNEIDLPAFFSSVLPAPNDDCAKSNRNLASFFWALLPEIDINALQVLACFQHLQSVGVLEDDSQWLDESLLRWAKKAPDRAAFFLAQVTADPNAHVPGLLQILVAGSTFDEKTYAEASVAMFGSQIPGRAVVAITAVGAMSLKSQEALSVAILALDAVVTDTNAAMDVRTAAYRSLLNIGFEDEAAIGSWLPSLLIKAREGLDQTQLRSVTAHGLTHRPFPPPPVFIEFAYEVLSHTTAIERDTINMTDHALYRIVDAGDVEGATGLVSALLSAQRDLSLNDFNSFVSALRLKGNAVQAVVVNWLLAGTPALCEAAGNLIGEMGGDDIRFSATPEMAKLTDQQRIRICHRAIGYMLHMAAMTTSLLIAIMEGGANATARDIGRLILQPLLINFPGGVRTYLTEIQEALPQRSLSVVQEVIAAFDSYSDAHTAVGRIRELEPSDAERYMAMEHRDDEMREAEKRVGPSPLMAIFPKVTILYGNKSVFSVYRGVDEPAVRTINPMTTYSVNYELPREATLDPVGQMYEQYRFRYGDGNK